MHTFRFVSLSSNSRSLAAASTGLASPKGLDCIAIASLRGHAARLLHPVMHTKLIHTPDNTQTLCKTALQACRNRVKRRLTPSSWAARGLLLRRQARRSGAPA